MVKIYQKYASSPALGIVASGLGNSLLSPSGQWAIVPALEDVHVWDVKTGSLIQTCRVSETASSLKNPPIVTCLCAHGAAAKEMIYSVGYSDGSIRLWDLGSPDHQPVLIQTLQGHSKAVTALSYSHHDRLLVSGSKDTDVIVWDLVAESGLFRLKKCHRDEITALVWISCDSNAKPTHLVSASKDSLIKVWDLKTQHCVETVLTHRGAVHSLDWIASESLLLSGSEDGQVRAWSVDLKTLSTKLDMEEEEESSKGAKEEEAAIKRALVLQGTLERASKEKVLHIKSLSKGDASFLAVQGSDSLVELYKIRSQDELAKKLARRKQRRKEKKNSKKPKDETTPAEDKEEEEPVLTITDRLPKWGQIKASAKIKSFDLTLTRGNALKKEQSLRILCHLSNNSIQLHELSHGSENQEHRILTTIELPGHRSDVRALALSSDDALFASGSSDLLKIWNTSSKTCLHSIPSGYILSVAFLPGNRYIVAGTKTGDLELFDLASGSLLDTYKAHEGPVWSLQIRPDKTGLVTGSQDKDVKFWDFRLTDHQSDGSTTKRITLAHTKTLKMTDDVLCIRISPDGRLLAVSLLDTTVKVFYTDSLKFFLSLYGHKLPVLSMDISSDNTLLVTGSSDKSIKLWGLDFGDCHKSLHAHDDSVTAVQFVWGTHFVFSASKDRSVKYWDMDKREKVQSLLGHQGEVWTLAVGKYGLFALSGSHDRSVRKWDKTEEQFVLDEAREEELEELYDQMDLSAEDGAIGSGAADAEPVEKEVGSAGLKTNETLKAGERIMEALIVAEEDRQALDLYDKLKQNDSNMAIPPRHPLIVAAPRKTPMDPEEFVLVTVQRIKSSQLEEALLVLPFSHVIKLLQNLAIWIEKSWNPRLTSRILFFLLRTHHNELVSTRALRPTLERIRTAHKKLLVEWKDTLGFNVAGLTFLKQELDARRSSGFMDDTPVEPEVEIKGKQRKRKAIVSR